MNSDRLYLTAATVLCLVGSAAFAAVTVDDPTGLAGDVNDNALTMVAEVGNIGLNDFNALDTSAAAATYRFTFEEIDGFPGPADTDKALAQVRLHDPPSGIDLTTVFNHTGAGFARLVTSWRPTGGTQDLVSAGGITLKITMDGPVDGVAFTVGRTLATATVTLYLDTALTVPFATFDMAPNGSGDEVSFFGYFQPGSDIRGIQINQGGGGQYGIDDFTLAVAPCVDCNDYLALVLDGVCGLESTTYAAWQADVQQLIADIVLKPCDDTVAGCVASTQAVVFNQAICDFAKLLLE